MIIKKINEKKVNGLYGIRTMCEYKCGRYIVKTLLTDGDDKNWMSYEIKYNRNGRKGNKVDDYAPDIYHYEDINGENSGEFKVQTTSYGSLAPDDYKMFIKAVTHAADVVVALTEYFLKED